MNCEVLTAEQPVALAVLGFLPVKPVVSRVVGPLPVPPHLVELWTFAPEKIRRGWPGLDEDGGGGGCGGRDGVGGAVAEWVRALACAGDRTVRVGFESHCGKLRNFGNSVYPVSVGRSLLSGVYARGSKISHQSALECVTVVDSTTVKRRTTLKITLYIILKFECSQYRKKKNKD